MTTGISMLKILIIEDDPDIRGTLKEVLELEDMEVLLACDGQQGLEQLRADSGIELVLLDLMMPVMNGWEFLEKKKMNAEWSKIPVIAVSAAGVKPTEVPVQAFIKKPLDLTVLIDTIYKLSK